MRLENQRMKEFLNNNGIEATPKYIASGSQRGLWRINNTEARWFNNVDLINTFNNLGFKDHDGDVLDNFSGNGGVFSVFVQAPRELNINCLTK